jgi:hypothetical protein
MAATFTLDSGRDGRAVAGDRFIRRGSGNLGTYATNGVSFTKASFDLPVSVDDVVIYPAGGYVFEVDKTNSKVKAYRQKDPGNAGGADIALPEVANAVDLSSVTFRFRAEGR